MIDVSSFIFNPYFVWNISDGKRQTEIGIGET